MSRLPRSRRCSEWWRRRCVPSGAVASAAGLRVAVVVALAVVGGGAAAVAHGLHMSQLRLRLDRARIVGEWDIQLPDVLLALGLDPALASDTGWRALREREASLRRYLTGQLVITANGAACPIALATMDALRPLTEPPEVAIQLSAQCPSEPVRLDLRCDLLFELDRGHRAYFSVEDARVTHAGLFRADRRAVTLDVHQFRAWEVVVDLVGEGARHIWGGLDHVLFLFALLLPAPLFRRGAWQARDGLASTVREVIKVVTAFTLAHSVTLTLAFFGLVLLPSRWVEVAIALSVFAAAWNNIRPFLPGRGWVLALGFGLVHGLGFAGVLRNLSLPSRARGLALGSFNVGVELGQLAIVAAVLPLLYLGSRRPWYPRRVMQAGSLAVAWLAVLWTLERATGTSFLPRFF